ncbi:uncharacterized protein PHACADRAFT_25180 [Phanerochaete carnosa HHB-10118-sp]|uniref:STB6-like N-terminal domain-containing protein n=1 Tax=Phanerochaete carnosa (strain HHB-10118-sp) TaxID=650164 RepID=K5W571_PHACS|nr:uncharacterized protein PHACADRAFT_25180 [Phanerochaete carnosa HHB-10118-sp]EKM59053.1 hypothetical protein PHACADRAFT_25180 [Phanerochaete carnosa HHB-10118-sp]
MSLQPPQRPRVLASTPHLSVPQSVSPVSSAEGGGISPLLPPFRHTRPTLSRHSTTSTTPSRQHRSPFLTPRTVNVNMMQSPHNSRLLMPTVRPPKQLPHTSPSFRISSSKSSPAKIARSRAGSMAQSLQTSPDPSASPQINVTVDWIGGGCRFEVVEDFVEIEGYQLYAVEKCARVVERTRSVTVLTVFTGDPNHKVTMTALSPAPWLSTVEAQAEWEKAIHQLRRDGARPRETEKGLVMVTSLANFRSDYTIVRIPGGNFLEIREGLYANINVLRMGCSGRSALTLEEPSDTTKDRFISAYHLPDQALIRSPELFKSVVLELVKLIQAALSVFGMFDMDREERNGLLCDVTCEGIQRWVAEIGEPLMNVEPMERVADPTVVAALFSMVMILRNKLHVMGYDVPKDPFIDPYSFIKSITSFATPKMHGHNHSLSLPHHLVASNVGMSSSTSIATSLQTAFVNRNIVEAIRAAYEKARQNESYKVHRVLISKLDDLATDLRTTPEPGGAAKSLFGWANSLKPTTDLEKFVQTITQNHKVGCSSLRYLWAGRPGEVERKRKEKEAIWSEGEEKEREKEAEKERCEKDMKSSDDEADDGNALPWSGRVQRKIENWAARGRPKKYSQDLGSQGKATDSPGRDQAMQTSLLPSVVVSRELGDDDNLLTSGQASPVSDSNFRTPLISGYGEMPRAKRSTGELSDYDRRVSEFNQRNPPAKLSGQARIASWSGAQISRGDDEYRGRSRIQRRGGSPLGKPVDAAEASRSKDNVAEQDDWPRPRERDLTALKRQRSSDDADFLRGKKPLPMDLMRLDVELCGQLLIMRRREQHLANVLSCLSALTTKLSESNTTIRQEYTAKATELEALHQRANVVQDVEAARARADAMTQEAHALEYESAQFLVDDLWHMAAAPRNKVLAMRERVFGTGRRLPQGVRGAHGTFNRLQWTLDGGGRLVDVHGRTESEAEEEEALPPIRPVVHEEEEVVEHASLKPTWLLRLFNYWGSRWGPRRGSSFEKDKDKDKGKEGGNGTGRSVEEKADGTSPGSPKEYANGRRSSLSGSSSGFELRSSLARNQTT